AQPLDGTSAIAHTGQRSATRRSLASPWALRSAADAAALIAAAALVGLSPASLAFFVVSGLALLLSGTYRRRISLSVLDDAPRLFMLLAVALMIVGTSAIFADVPSSLFVQAIV